MSDPKRNNSKQGAKVHPIFLKLAGLFWPELQDRPSEQQIIGVGEVISTLYSLPFLFVGLFWLVNSTDLNLLQEEAGLYLVFAALIVIFNQLGFFLIIELRRNRYGSTDGALTGVPLWSGVLILGPTILWLPILWSCYQLVTNWRRTSSKTNRWGLIRNFSMNLVSETLVPLIAFSIYRLIGGRIPLDGLSIQCIFRAMVMLVANFIAYAIFWSPYLVYHIWAQHTITTERDSAVILRFFFLAISLPQLANPFAILAAGLLNQSGILVFFYFIAGMITVAYLAQRLSWSAERSRQSSRLLEKLEALSRSIINAPPDTENLPQILQEHVSNMFPAGRLVIWIFPEEILAQHPPEWVPDLEKIWPWLLNLTEGKTFLGQETLPWLEDNAEHNPVVVAPILEVESSQTFGGIYLELHTLAQPWNRKALMNLYPAVQALAAQIASAINQKKSYQQALELNRVNEELKLAGNIQASLLPFSFPDMPGWQLAVTLDPAGETSGDFFDVIPLDGNRIGFLIADVLDKGLGPALYMTLSRTLIRTYATEFDLQPDLVFFATNNRILRDTRANLFVTVFFGVVDLNSGQMTYSNAGHNPPYIISEKNGEEPIPLEKTGFPLGIDEDGTWSRETVQIHPGDVLILYTDGVPDAQNPEGDFFRQQRLVDVAMKNLGQTAEDLQKSILDAVYDFVMNAPAFDDITLMVLVRDEQD
jgi:serine phosphatase RsbU (regulator of sigma subunit)